MYPEGTESASESSARISVALTNPGFESDKTGWGNESLFEISTSDKHSGSKSAKVTGSGDRVEQTVTVTPNTTYVLEAWVLGKGTVGVKAGSTVLGSQSLNSSAWSRATITFSSGSATSVALYGAYNGGTGRFDNFTLATTDTPPPEPEPEPDPEPDPEEPAEYPSEVLDLTHWKLTLPIDTSHAGSPDEIKRPELDTFLDSTYFRVNATGDAVAFKAHTGGYTTSGSGYPRSELREMTSNGASNASWSSSSGKHTLFIDQKVTHLPDVKKHIVVGQIHDGDDDVIVFRLEGQKLFIDLNGDDGPTLTSNYVLGTRFTVKFEVQNNVVKCYYNGTLAYSYPKSFTGAYFKAGAYVQSSCQGSKKITGESCSAYGEVELYDLQVQHQ
ncbi:polyguluronate lyase precursor [Chondromyces apiculatus DSM 436]|uniref:Polyguluronate lyase n=1 Tax=Chondromyces apiculatus DSM 436 TaxID=1192034 RepID=A0A017SY00_9BACT|nr:polyguluronate lyase precursor [Chondromyces apiculatus DSM 436]